MKLSEIMEGIFGGHPPLTQREKDFGSFVDRFNSQPDPNAQSSSGSDRPSHPPLKRRAGADDRMMTGGTHRLSGKAGAVNKGQQVGQKQKMIWDFVRQIADTNSNDAKQEYNTWVSQQPPEEQKKLIAYFNDALAKYQAHN